MISRKTHNIELLLLSMYFIDQFGYLLVVSLH